MNSTSRIWSTPSIRVKSVGKEQNAKSISSRKKSRSGMGSKREFMMDKEISLQLTKQEERLELHMKTLKEISKIRKRRKRVFGKFEL